MDHWKQSHEKWTGQSAIKQFFHVSPFFVLVSDNTNCEWMSTKFSECYIIWEECVDAFHSAHLTWILIIFLRNHLDICYLESFVLAEFLLLNASLKLCSFLKKKQMRAEWWQCGVYFRLHQTNLRNGFFIVIEFAVLLNICNNITSIPMIIIGNWTSLSNNEGMHYV